MIESDSSFNRAVADLPIEVLERLPPTQREIASKGVINWMEKGRVYIPTLLKAGLSKESILSNLRLAKAQDTDAFSRVDRAYKDAFGKIIEENPIFIPLDAVPEQVDFHLIEKAVEVIQKNKTALTNVLQEALLELDEATPTPEPIVEEGAAERTILKSSPDEYRDSINQVLTETAAIPTMTSPPSAPFPMPSTGTIVGAVLGLAMTLLSKR